MDSPGSRADSRHRFGRPPLMEETMRIRALARGVSALLTLAAVGLMTAPAFAQTGEVQLVGDFRRCQPCPPQTSVCPEPSPTPKAPGEAPRPAEVLPQAAEPV